MFTRFIEEKFNILSQPLPALNSGQRRFLRTLLLCFHHLIHDENLNRQTLERDPLIFALNHNSSYESILVPAYLIFLRQGRKISFTADWMFGKIPVLKWLYSQIDPIYVYNKPSTIKQLNKFRNKSRAHTVYEECLKRLKNGDSIGIFPEGTRNNNPENLLKGRQGIGYIALHSKIPVLPIGIDFPARIKKGRIPKFGSLILRAGDQMTFPEETALYHLIKTAGPAETVRKKLSDYLTKKVTYQVMKELSRLSGKQYPFQPPVPPVEMKRFLFEQVLVKKITERSEYHVNY